MVSSEMVMRDLKELTSNMDIFYKLIQFSKFITNYYYSDNSVVELAAMHNAIRDTKIQAAKACATIQTIAADLARK